MQKTKSTFLYRINTIKGDKDESQERVY